MRLSRLSIAVAVALVPSVACAAARPVVLELFTSEGCSSCPPADALLTSLAGRRDLLPLAFHVTYWNALGWRDSYSFEAATNRQADYAARLGGGSYTPEMVVDGQRGMVGSQIDEVTAAISAARQAAVEPVPVMLARAGNTVSILVGPGTGQGHVLLIGFDPRHETRIGRGENGGRTLIESNVVRSLRRVADYAGTPVRLAVPPGPGAEIAVLVQAPDGRILGAARSEPPLRSPP